MADAIQMLLEDHRKVQELFRQFEEAESMEEKGRIAEAALKELTVHANLEEEIFYPAARQEIEEEEKIDQAEEEHHVARLLIAELERMDPEDERYNAKFTVLAESVKHHIEEEESSLIPEIEDALDTEELGEQMEVLKQELQERLENTGSSRKRAARSSRRRSVARKKSPKRAKSGGRS